MEEERLYDVYSLEEDIKYAEKAIYGVKTYGSYGHIFNDKEVQAIEHLIEQYKLMQAEFHRLEDLEDDRDILKARIKELEEKKKIWVKIDGNNNIIPLLELKDYIPKSKIKEKIEELEKYMIEDEFLDFSSEIDVLQELLEEE